MNRFRSFRIPALILLTAVAVFGAKAADQDAATAAHAASGAYAVTFHVNTPTTIPDGATIVCKARIAPRLSLFSHLIGQTAAAESPQGFARVANSSADCTVAVPFAFSAANLRTVAALSYEIEAYTSAGPVFARTQQGIPLAHPPAGAAATVPVEVNF